MTLEEKIAKMQNGKPNSIYFTFNDFWGYHEAIADHIEELDSTDFIDDEDRQKCIETNSLWHVQWYVRTTVGFIDCYASTLEKAIDHLLESQK